MHNEDKNVCSVLFNSAYYLATQERPLSNFSNLLKLQEKNKTPSIKNCYTNYCAGGNFTDATGEVMTANSKYFCVLSNGSTESSVI